MQRFHSVIGILVCAPFLRPPSAVIYVLDPKRSFMGLSTTISVIDSASGPKDPVLRTPHQCPYPRPLRADTARLLLRSAYIGLAIRFSTNDSQFAPRATVKIVESAY